MLKPRRPIAIHPGEVLQLLLDESGITQTTLAEHLNMPQSKISQICRGKHGISAEMALKLAKTLNMLPDLWITMQKNWELSQVLPAKLAQVRKIKTSHKQRALIQRKAA